METGGDTIHKSSAPAVRPWSAAKPFLKWAGSKQRMIGRLQAEFDQIAARHGPLNQLVEPFAGSGAVFLGTNYPRSIVSDVNEDIINVFQQAQQHGETFLEEASHLFRGAHSSLEAFHKMRAEFNANKSGTAEEKTRKAALFIYLNRHCFNGLCRYNVAGGFNVPYGKYAGPGFPEKEIRAFIAAAQRAEFRAQGFEETMADPRIGPGSVVYCDPPYMPLSETSSFSRYARLGFGAKEHQRLAGLARILADNGAAVIISNHDTETARETYREATRIEAFTVGRSISGKGSGRKTAPEILAIYEPA